MSKVLLTGITGFLGSHIAEVLIKSDVQVIGLKRANSNLSRCEDFLEKIEWIDIDQGELWKAEVVKNSSLNVIHCAWIGVEAKDRGNWKEQIKNIEFLVDLIDVLASVKVEKFIFLGSQAEYGNINGKISEEEIPSSKDAYSGVKLACLEILKAFCAENRITWVWLRVFSVFGEKEGRDWLIPSVIERMLKDSEMDLTAGDQRYAYLYVKDFASIIAKVMSCPIISGIYNVSSECSRSLKQVIELIRNQVNPKFKLNFGALPYRPNQSMHIEGDMTKMKSQIGDFEMTPFEAALKRTVEYYISKRVKE